MLRKTKLVVWNTTVHNWIEQV